MFTTYVTPLTNIPYERCVFNSRRKKSNDTFLQYVTEIKRLGDKCELTKITVDEILRDRILLGLRDENLRKRILKDNKLTLQTLIRTCQAEEMTESQNHRTYEDENVHQITKSTKKQL